MQSCPQLISLKHQSTPPFGAAQLTIALNLGGNMDSEAVGSVGVDLAPGCFYKRSSISFWSQSVSFKQADFFFVVLRRI